MNLSSVVVQTLPDNLDELLKILQNSDFCEYHLHDEKGRIIVTIEGKNTESEVAKMQQLQSLPQVLSAEMVFSFSEEELEKEKDKLEKNGKIPDWLNDPNAKLKDIKYQGDLKGQF
ncbi:MAG: chaperone NapD [Bacteroidetes bacterium]|nr:chaperone NapD [Bacteroidota bacterium]